MSLPSAKLLVLASEQLAIVKIVGRANVASSVDFRRLVDELMAKGFTCFVLDLSECILMDSTFLGVLAGLGLKINTPENGAPSGRFIELLNANPRIADLLDNLGVAHLFRLRQAVLDSRPAVNGGAAAPASGHTREETTRTCLEAHRTLMAINPDNISKFKDVTLFLAEDLKKLKAAQ